MVRPNIAVITTVAAAHLEFFKSITEIAEAKAEIFLGVEPGGTAVLNADHDYIHVLFARARQAGIEDIVTYGYDDEADWHIGSAETAGARTFARVTHDDEVYDLNLGVRGQHMVANATAALAVARLAGMDRYAALKALRRFRRHGRPRRDDSAGAAAHAAAVGRRELQRQCRLDERGDGRLRLDHPAARQEGAGARRHAGARAAGTRTAPIAEAAVLRTGAGGFF